MEIKRVSHFPNGKLQKNKVDTKSLESEVITTSTFQFRTPKLKLGHL